MAIVKDRNGRVLAVAEVAVRGPGPLLGFKRIDCPERLFTYYFFRGERTIRVEVEDVQFAGRLVTRWQDNHRVWALAVAPHDKNDGDHGKNEIGQASCDGRPLKDPVSLPRVASSGPAHRL